MPKPGPPLTKASAVEGVTWSKACCQAAERRGASAMPFVSVKAVAKRAPRVEVPVCSVLLSPASAAAPPVSVKQFVFARTQARPANGSIATPRSATP